MYWPIFFLFIINNHYSLKTVLCYVSCAEFSPKMFLRCSGWIWPHCYVVAGDSGWLSQRWYMVGKVLRVNFLRLSLHLWDFSSQFYGPTDEDVASDQLLTIPHLLLLLLLNNTHGLRNYSGLELHIISKGFVKINWISQNGHTDMLHMPKYAFLYFVK